MRTSWRTILTAATAVAILAGAPAVAERTRFWRQSNYDEFEKGTAKGVALRSDGKLVLAPRFAQFSDPNSAYLWALRADSKGTLYAAGGSNAKVMKFDANGEPVKVFESGELAAQALVIDAKDNLYIATSPDGKVYKVTPAGQQSVFFEPKTKYIWDLALGPNGNLYVATGDKGEVFEVAPDGKGQLYYKSEEVHARALAFDAKGNLIVGTDPNGLILRVEKPKAASKPGEAAGAPLAFVLYETAKKEVTSLLTDGKGNLYAASVGDKPRGAAAAAAAAQQLIQQAAAQAAAVAAASAQAAQAGVTPQIQPPLVTFPQIGSTGGGSEVYRIAPDGAPEQLWSSRDELVYSLGFSAAGKLLLGTGNKGQLIQLEGNGIYSSLAKTASSQITGVAQGPGRKVFVCTANPGKVFTLGPDFEAEGTFESQAFDAKVFSQWGRLNWWGDNGATHGQVAFYVRSGNTSNPEKNWSAWAGPYSNARGEATAIPAARFVQWKAVFKAPPAVAGKTELPESISISWVNLAYLPKNVAPTVDSVVVQLPGVRVQGAFNAPSGGGTGNQPAQLRLPPVPGQNAPSTSGQAQRFEPPPQGFVARGFQSVLWSARDENDDELTYSIYYRGESEKNWKLLKDKLDAKFYSWDAGTMPDGAYYLKVVASDAPANPAGEALTAERESDRFEVDNTPPAAVNLRAEQNSPEVRVQFEARDSYSSISRVEYSLDAGEWTLVFPTDRATDASQESFELLLRGVSPGEHTLAVRVYDQFENSSSAKITFVVKTEPRK